GQGGLGVNGDLLEIDLPLGQVAGGLRRPLVEELAAVGHRVVVAGVEAETELTAGDGAVDVADGAVGDNGAALAARAGRCPRARRGVAGRERPGSTWPSSSRVRRA